MKETFFLSFNAVIHTNPEIQLLFDIILQYQIQIGIYMEYVSPSRAY